MLPPALVVILMQKWFVKGLVDTKNRGQTAKNNPGTNQQAICPRLIKKHMASITLSHILKTYGAGDKANTVIHDLSARDRSR
jgi:hypothetical protein